MHVNTMYRDRVSVFVWCTLSSAAKTVYSLPFEQQWHVTIFCHFMLDFILLSLAIFVIQSLPLAYQKLYTVITKKCRLCIFMLETLPYTLNSSTDKKSALNAKISVLYRYYLVQYPRRGDTKFLWNHIFQTFQKTSIEL